MLPPVTNRSLARIARAFEDPKKNALENLVNFFADLYDWASDWYHEGHTDYLKTAFTSEEFIPLACLIAQSTNKNIQETEFESVMQVRGAGFDYTFIETVESDKSKLRIIDNHSGETVELRWEASLHQIIMMSQKAISKYAEFHLNEAELYAMYSPKFQPISQDRLESSPTIKLGNAKGREFSFTAIELKEAEIQFIDGRKLMNLGDFTLIEHKTGRVEIVDHENEAVIGIDAADELDLSLKAIQLKATSVQAKQEAIGIFGDPDNCLASEKDRELTNIYCMYSEFVETLNAAVDHHNLSVRCELCVKYLKQDPERLRILNKIFPMDGVQNKKISLDKSDDYTIYCINSNRLAQDSEMKLKAASYGIAISAVTTFYNTLKAIDREDANKSAMAEAKRLFGDTSNVMASEMDKGLTTMYCMFMDFNVSIDSTREDRDEKFIQYLKTYPKQLENLMGIFYGNNGDFLGSTFDEYITYCDHLYLTAKDDDLAGEYESFKVVVGTLYNAMLSLNS